MKKKLMVFAALLCAIVCAFAFVACNKDEGGSGETAQSVVGEKVTAEQWAAALKEDNFTQGKVVVTNTQTGDIRTGENDYARGTATITTTYTIAGDKQYSKTQYAATGDAELVTLASQMGTQEEYSWKIDDGIFIQYAQDYEDRTKWEFEVYRQGLVEYELDEVLECADMYDEFVYDDAKKGYVPKEDSEYFEDEALTLKFKDNKLVAVIDEYEVTRNEKTTKYTNAYVITYGTQSVTLPTMPESPMAGTWELKTLKIYHEEHGYGGTYGVGDEIEGLTGGEKLKAEDVTIVINSDGTASFVFMKGTPMEESGNGAWEWWTESGTFYSTKLPSDMNGSMGISYVVDDDDEESEEKVLSFTVNTNGYSIGIKLVKKAA